MRNKMDLADVQSSTSVPFAKGGTLFYGACLQEYPLLFQQVLRHAQCVVQTSHPGKFTTLRAVSLRVWLETQHDLYVYAYAS